MHNCLYIKTVLIRCYGNNEIMTCPPFKFYSGNNGLLGQKDTISKASNALSLCFKLTCVMLCCCRRVMICPDAWLPFFHHFKIYLVKCHQLQNTIFTDFSENSRCMAHSFSLTHSLCTFVWQQNASGSTVTSDNSIAGRNKLDVLKNKARSSLTSSLENIFSRVCVCVVRLCLSCVWMGIDPFTPPLY